MSDDPARRYRHLSRVRGLMLGLALGDALTGSRAGDRLLGTTTSQLAAFTADPANKATLEKITISLSKLGVELDRSGKFLPAAVTATYNIVDQLISSLGAAVALGAVALIGFTEVMPQPTDGPTTAILFMTMGLFFGLPMLGWVINLLAMRGYVLDREEMIAVLWEGTGYPNNALPAGIRSYYIDPRGADMGPNAKYFKRDVDAAKKLLLDCGTVEKSQILPTDTITPDNAAEKYAEANKG